MLSKLVSTKEACNQRTVSRVEDDEDLSLLFKETALQRFLLLPNVRGGTPPEMNANKHRHRNRKWHDPTKTTCRNNPKGGKSPALMRATNICAALEARAGRLRKSLSSDKARNDAVEFGMSVATEMKHCQ